MEKRLENYRFDPKFCLERGECEDSCDEKKGKPGGAQAVFKLVGHKGILGFPGGEKEIMLILFNCHNGYYSHGFHMDVNKKKIREGSL